MRARISGIGVYRPQQQVTAEELRSLGQDIKDAPEKRYFASESETSVAMSVASAQSALRNAGVKAEEIGIVLFFSGIPDYEVPKDANLVLKELGAVKAAAWTLDTACASFISQLRAGEMLIRSGECEHVMLINTMHWVTRAVDKTQPYATLGDGSASVILSRTEGNPAVLAVIEKGEPEHFDFIKLDSPFATGKMEKISFSHDTKHSRFFLRNATDSAGMALQKAEIPASDIDWFVAHQTGLAMLRRWSNALDLPESKNLNTFHETGNMSSVNIPYILHKYIYEEPKIERGQKLLLFAVGAGLHVAAMVFEY
jgi:3-oxoacyl-[acyl-carrier-protein] synthase III